MKLSPIQRLTPPPSRHARGALFIGLLLSPVLADIGCQHIGPPTIAEDRLAYNEAIASSWKEQILLNLVRLRYSDMAEFVDVSTLSQNYSLMRQASASFGASLLPWNVAANTLTPSLMGSRTKTDNPTVTYTPQSGSDFTKNLIAPITPDELFNLFEEHYHHVMNLAVESINDIRNDPYNAHALVLFRTLALAISTAYCKGDIRFPIETDSDGKNKKAFMIIEEQDSENKPCPIDPNDRLLYLRTPLPEPVAFIRKTLRLKPGLTKFEIVVGWRRTKENEIAVRTHSPISAMITLSLYVPKPESSLANSKESSTLYDAHPPLTVYTSSTDPGKQVYAKVKYRDIWFWVKSDDPASNRAMVYLRTLLALADKSARPSNPVLTIPVSR